MKKVLTLLLVLSVGLFLPMTTLAVVGDVFYGEPFWQNSTASSGLCYYVLSEPDIENNKAGQVELIVAGDVPYSASEYTIPGWVKRSGDPASALPYIVVSIAGKVFQDHTTLQSVTIEEGVKEIQIEAFRGCTNLTSVTLPDGMTKIGASAFRECTNLKSITLPDSVTLIDGFAFSDCTSLQSINLPESLKTIATNAFYNCSQLKEITLPNGVTEIGSWAFGGCSSLRSVVIPESVTLIDEYAFRACPNLATVTIMVVDDGDDGVPTIGQNAFSDETTVGYDYRLGAPVITVDEASQTISWTEGSTRADAYDVTFFEESGQQMANIQTINVNSIHYATATALAFASNGNYYCTVRARDDIKLIGDKDYRPSDVARSELFLYVSFDANGFAVLPQALGVDAFAAQKLNAASRTIEVSVGENQTVAVPLKVEVIVGGTALAPTYTAQLVFANNLTEEQRAAVMPIVGAGDNEVFTFSEEGVRLALKTSVVGLWYGYATGATVEEVMASDMNTTIPFVQGTGAELKLSPVPNPGAAHFFRVLALPHNPTATLP